MWDSVVDVIRVTIFAVSHLCAGSLGGGILVVSVAARLSLLPLTLRVARQQRAQQEAIAALAPEMERLRRRYAHDRARLLAETQALYAARGIRLLTPATLMSLGVQIPLLGGVFAAVRRGLGAGVRFLWVGDLARPDVLLVAAGVALGAATVMTAPPVAGKPPAAAAAWLVAGMTLAFLWSASGAVALSAGAGSLVSLLQNWILARDSRRDRTPEEVV